MFLGKFTYIIHNILNVFYNDLEHQELQQIHALMSIFSFIAMGKHSIIKYKEKHMYSKNTVNPVVPSRWYSNVCILKENMREEVLKFPYVHRDENILTNIIEPIHIKPSLFDGIMKFPS